MGGLPNTLESILLFLTCIIFCCEFFKRPTIDEVRCWSDNFDRLMQSPSGRYYFRDFLRSEYSEENMLFWMACEELKNELHNPEIVEEKARNIYEDYISILSNKEVRLR